MTNPADLAKHSEILREQINSSLEKAQAQRNTLKQNNSRYTAANIILGAIVNVTG
jgi:hypothetical protein